MNRRTLSLVLLCGAVLVAPGVSDELRKAAAVDGRGSTPALADLRLEKSVDELVPKPGDDVVFTVKVTNDGPSPATGVQIRDLLPSGLVFVSAVPSQGVYSDATGIWDFQATSLASGAMATLDITASVDPEPGNPSGTGLLIDEFVGSASGGLFFPEGLTFGPDDHLYVSNSWEDEVLRYDGATGAFIDVFVSAGSGGLWFPVGLAFGPDGHLYVSSEQTHQVLRYDGTTGAFIDVFATVGSGTWEFPQRLIFGPDGNLYVVSIATNEVLRYDGITGAFIDDFVSAGSGGLNSPRGLRFGPDGNLYVVAGDVYRYAGTTGAFLDIFSDASGFDITFGPGGDLYAAGAGGDEVRRYDGTTGAFVEALGVGQLDNPRSLAFGPDGHLYVTSGDDDSVLRFDGFITNRAEVVALDPTDPDLTDNRARQGIEHRGFDFGDAPDPLAATDGEYPTLLANDGARHIVPAPDDAAPLLLGSSIDAESDGQPTAGADGDDDDGNNDDDGVQLSSQVAGRSSFVDVTVSGTGGLLNAWFDFDQDRVWTAAEQIFADEPVAVGETRLTYTLPADAALGQTFARFRLDSAGGLEPTGIAADGEVEDYLTPTIDSRTDLTITKSDSPDPTPPGEDLTYTITVLNNGPSDAYDVVVTDTLPAGVTLVGTSGCAEDPGGVADCTLGTIAAGSSKQYSLVVNMDPDTRGFIYNYAIVTSTSFLYFTDDDWVHEGTAVLPPLVFAKTFQPGSVVESFDTTLTFNIDNSADVVDATNLSFNDTLPFDLLVSSAPNVTNSCGGTVLAGPSTTTVSLSSGAVDAGASCTISVDVSAPSPGLFENVTSGLYSSSGISVPASDTLTVIDCPAPDGAQLLLEDDLVETEEAYEVCYNIVVAGPYQVVGPKGELTLTAGAAVALFDGVVFGPGAVVAIRIDPSLIP